MENSTGNADKKSTKWTKITKQRKNAGICRDKKEKATQEKGNTRKITILEEINQKILLKEGRFKKIFTKSKTIQTKQNIPKQRKKILPTSWER